MRQGDDFRNLYITRILAYISDLGCHGAPKVWKRQEAMALVVLFKKLVREMPRVSPSFRDATAFHHSTYSMRTN